MTGLKTFLCKARFAFWAWLYRHGPNWYWIFSHAFDATLDYHDMTGSWVLMFKEVEG